jgi:hypothetical protein
MDTVRARTPHMIHSTRHNQGQALHKCQNSNSSLLLRPLCCPLDPLYISLLYVSLVNASRRCVCLANLVRSLPLPSRTAAPYGERDTYYHPRLVICSRRCSTNRRVCSRRCSGVGRRSSHRTKSHVPHNGEHKSNAPAPIEINSFITPPPPPELQCSFLIRLHGAKSVQ